LTIVSSPGFSVFTPDSVRSPVSSIDFQTLSLVELRQNGPLDVLSTISEKVMFARGDTDESCSLRSFATNAVNDAVSSDDIPRSPLLPPAVLHTKERPVNLPSITEEQTIIDSAPESSLETNPPFTAAPSYATPLKSSKEVRKELNLIGRESFNRIDVPVEMSVSMPIVGEFNPKKTGEIDFFSLRNKRFPGPRPLSLRQPRKYSYTWTWTWTCVRSYET
jgi:hypothetical protein